MLLPVFFAVAGFAVDLSEVGGSVLGELALVPLVAVGGKGLGTYIGACTSGIRVRPSATLAILLNTRGLVELIALTVGLQLGKPARDARHSAEHSDRPMTLLGFILAGRSRGLGAIATLVTETVVVQALRIVVAARLLLPGPTGGPKGVRTLPTGTAAPVTVVRCRSSNGR